MNHPAPSVDAFRAISDPTRRRILDLLSDGERPVAALASQFDMTLPAVSQHLKVLRDAALVYERREGRQRLYRVNAAPLRNVAEWVGQYERFWREKLDALGKYLDYERERENPTPRPRGSDDDKGKKR